MGNKIFSEQFGALDMSWWLGEKTGYVIDALLGVYKEIDNINKEPEMPHGHEYTQENIEKEVKGTIVRALFNLTKIYSFAIGGDWAPSDKSFVLENGRAALQERYFRYESRGGAGTEKSTVVSGQAGAEYGYNKANEWHKDSTSLINSLIDALEAHNNNSYEFELIQKAKMFLEEK